MDSADSESEGGAVKALGSLFKLTEAHLWDDSARVSHSAPLSKSAEADDLNGFNLVPTTEDYCGILPEDTELNRQMSALGLPLSFHTNKERNGPMKGKKKGTKLKHPDSHQNPKEEGLSKVSSQMVVSNANFHDKTSSSLCCISVLGESELSCSDVAVDVDVSQCAPGEGDLSSSTRIADGVYREQNDDDMYEATINGVQNGGFSTNNIVSSDDSKIASSSNDGASARSLWAHPNTNHCERKTGGDLVGHKDREHESICYNDGTSTWQQWAHESVSFPINSEGSGFEGISAQPKSYDEFGDWMVCWDTLYMRNYFCNIKTNDSVWDPPPGMEHLATVGCTEVNDTATQQATQEYGSHSMTNLLEETLINEKLTEKPHDECLAEIGVATDSLVTDVTIHCEGQSLNHLDDCLEDNSCSDRDSFCSIPNAPQQITSFHEGCVKEDSECNDVFLENMVPVLDGLGTESYPSLVKQKKKVKRKRRQRRLCSETGLQSPEMHEEYPAAIAKYWCQRYILFSRYDDGIKMDEEGWFSVTPEPIAWHHALRCSGGIIIDCFAGVGGNAIQFAQRCRHVIAIDIDQQRINFARHNAGIYGVDSQIDFIIGDFFLLAPKLKADTVFLSPPWGGPDYAKIMTYDIKTMLKPRDGYVLFNVAKEIASKVVMFLPRNVDLNQLAELSLSACPPWSLEVEKIFLNGRLKAITAYFSETSVAGC